MIRRDEVLNQETLASLREFGAFLEIAREFLKEAPRRAQAMRQAAVERRFDRVKHEAHTLKGASGAVGAIRLATVSAKIEESAREQSIADLTVLVEQLGGDLELTRDALMHEVAKSST